GNQIEWSLNDKELAELARQPQDAAPPRVILADADKTITLYNDEYALDIRAEDDVSLKNIQLNGIELLTEKSRIFRSLHRVPLSLGTNHFSIVAEDTVGKRTEKQIHVIRREPEYLDRHYRLATALPPISGELPDKLFGRRIELLMGEEITRDPARFYLLATDHEAEKILNEQALSSTELSDPRAALNRGGRLDSDLVFLNRVLSDGDGQTIYTQVVDAKSGDELFVEDVYLENRQQLEQQIGGLIMKLEQRFPLITALIVERGKLIAINAGTQNGVQNGTRFLIVRSDGAFEQGHVLQNKTRPAELIVSEIESASSRGIVTSETAEHSVRPGDYVFTR
ncbi:MAG: hypothetical protein JEZ10_09175, partial [Verrucomicrobia bacterium]|nr:hypothetical protein [Verrucomicrobiota bacterium]